MKTFTDGEWVYVECDASDMSVVAIQVGNGPLQSAFRSQYEGYRVAQVRLPYGLTGVRAVRLWVDGVSSRADNLSLSG